MVVVGNVDVVVVVIVVVVVVVIVVVVLDPSPHSATSSARGPDIPVHERLELEKRVQVEGGPSWNWKYSTPRIGARILSSPWHSSKVATFYKKKVSIRECVIEKVPSTKIREGQFRHQ